MSYMGNRCNRGARATMDSIAGSLLKRGRAMFRVSSRSFHRVLLSISSLLLLMSLVSLAAYSQSLGDVARENRDKKAADVSTTPPKVITNKDLPKNPDGYAGPPAEESTPQTPSPSGVQASREAARQRAAEQRAAEYWKKRILAQEYVVANLQARVAHMRASIHLANPNASYDYNGAQAYNAYQARQLERLAQMQQQLDQQKRRLEDLQEAARHAGMHSLVYDP